VRIISGSAKGLQLYSPGKREKSIRPTSDRVREAVFNVLAQKILASDILDLFSGTGALGIEALSRGALGAVFVDNSSKALQLIRKNIVKYLETTGEDRQIKVVKKDLSGNFGRQLSAIIQGRSFDLIFADPPYGRISGPALLENIDGAALLKPNGILVLEESTRTTLPEEHNTLRLTEMRRYGDTGIFVYCYLNRRPSMGRVSEEVSP
jgi:16S rRNA (guanine966-N2)-methyltransferase